MLGITPEMGVGFWNIWKGWETVAGKDMMMG